MPRKCFQVGRSLVGIAESLVKLYSAKFRCFATGPVPSNRWRLSCSESGEAELTPAQAAQQRKLDRVVRWNCFLYFTNRLWIHIAKERYGNDFNTRDISPTLVCPCHLAGHPCRYSFRENYTHDSKTLCDLVEVCTSKVCTC